MRLHVCAGQSWYLHWSQRGTVAVSRVIKAYCTIVLFCTKFFNEFYDVSGIVVQWNFSHLYCFLFFLLQYVYR